MSSSRRWRHLPRYSRRRVKSKSKEKPLHKDGWYLRRSGGGSGGRCRQRMVLLSNSGALVAATEGSTRPVTMTITNGGIATVEQYDLQMP